MKITLELPVNAISEERIEDLLMDQDYVTVDSTYEVKGDKLVRSFEPHWEDTESVDWFMFVQYITDVLLPYL